MARRLRIECAGAIYHVVCRGVERRAIFSDDQDRRRLLSRLGRATADCQVRLYLYCLMPNHLHLLVETPMANLHQFMHKLETAYTVYFNLRHHRVGHLMQGRYRAQPVQGNEYLLKLSRYLHLNPVFARALRDAPLAERLAALRAYRWSSYREYVGMTHPVGFLVSRPLLRLVGGSAGDTANEYGRYVEAGLARNDLEFEALLHSSTWALGDEQFREQSALLYQARTARRGCPEDVAFRRARARRSVDEVLQRVGAVFGLTVAELRQRRYGCRARAVAARMLCRHAGLSQREVGRVLNLGTGAAVCQQLRTLERSLETDVDLQRREQQVEEGLFLNS